MDGGGLAGFAMWSLAFAKNPLDFVANSSSFDLDESLFRADLKSGEVGWATLGNQSQLNIEVLHLLSLPEDDEVSSHIYVEMGVIEPDLSILHLTKTWRNPFFSRLKMVHLDWNCERIAANDIPSPYNINILRNPPAVK